MTTLIPLNRDPFTLNCHFHVGAVLALPPILPFGIICRAEILGVVGGYLRATHAGFRLQQLGKSGGVILGRSSKVGPAFIEKLLQRIGNRYGETRRLARDDELPNTSQRLVLQAKQVQGWQQFCDHPRGNTFECISDKHCQRCRNPQNLHSGESTEEFQLFTVVHIVSPTRLQVVHTNGETIHVGERSESLDEHLGQMRNLPI
ncbi:hypothetical protein BJY52DRAFT_1379633 [Lactarius psammicola]|nr:hypothetical protein BJY52DRAFT_1379633 [Lactarius psammicola]